MYVAMSAKKLVKRAKGMKMAMRLASAALVTLCYVSPTLGATIITYTNATKNYSSWKFEYATPAGGKLLDDFQNDTLMQAPANITQTPNNSANYYGSLGFAHFYTLSSSSVANGGLSFKPTPFMTPGNNFIWGSNEGLGGVFVLTADSASNPVKVLSFSLYSGLGAASGINFSVKTGTETASFNLAQIVPWDVVKDDGVINGQITIYNDDGSNIGLVAGVGFGSTTFIDNFIVSNASPVPEPLSWMMMITGFGLVGGSLRRQRSTSVRFADHRAAS